MSKTIADYTAAVSIDAANDYLLIEPSGNTVYNKINRNVLLGLASAPLGTTDSQSPTNKTFDNTNVYTTKDANFTLQNSSSTTKQAKFSLASITAGQTRTLTVPDADLTIVGTATTQTLTNKTLTSPTISGGTIDNSTITVDSISGHSVATTVTVANLQIANGVLNSANAVTATSIAAGAIQPQALVSGTGSGWAWSSWSPTWTNLTKGNGTETAKYIQIGKAIFARYHLVFGTTSAISGDASFTLPVTSQSLPGGANLDPIGNVTMFNAGSTINFGYVSLGSTTSGVVRAYDASATYLKQANLSSTIPFTWATNYELAFNLVYEAA